ncbi:hypothetical protein AMATHDRAFT_6762 [Amanita thiersii Skay4041]|uniref:Beta-lactamase-related domain-containing protein n=1 Tax=Amanita thiersii Skay4041 TaxID=703135 RepID=A0A2A9NI99_9AGAR|nr:hypothetical protein AMATHDRAFT_6762 [Amanita thiersii Skay4041]
MAQGEGLVLNHIIDHNIQVVESVLQVGNPESVGLASQPFTDLQANISAYTVPRNYGSPSFNQVHPLYPGATVIVGHDNTIVSHFAVGYTSKYSHSNGTELPVDQWVQAATDTIWDMASLTKMFTTITGLQQLERGNIALDATVASYIPEFANQKGKEDITILMLFTHTSGFDADPVPDLWSGYPTYDERKQAIIQQNIINTPGNKYLYSDLNYMVLQFVLEAVTSRPLDQLLQEDFTGPLGMNDTFFNRGNADIRDRIAPTEFEIEVQGPNEPDRPQPVWGTVHDENAWSLDGVSGHAGVFSTSMDLAIFCQMILNNGTYNSVQILKPETVDLIFHNFNTRFPGDAHGLGFELNQFYWSGAMQSLQTAGHTGYTGTSMAIDRSSNTFFVLLTNRVHPSRSWSNINIVRENLGYFVAKALRRI